MTDTATIPDFFTLLELDPDVPWSDAAYKARFKEKRHRWTQTSTTGFGAGRDAAKLYLSLLVTIDKEMSDPAARAVHGERARQSRNAAHQATMAEFEQLLQGLQKRGFLYKAEETKLLSTYGSKLGVSLIKSKITVPVVKDEEVVQQVTLPLTIRKDIARLLEVVGKENLYDFVGGESGAGLSTSVLLRKAKELESAANGNANKNDPQVNASGKLAGFALTSFANDAARKIYDATLDDEIYLELDKKVDLLILTAVVITSDQVKWLLEEARQASSQIDIGIARNRIVSRAQAKNKPIQVPPDEVIQSQQLCGWCKKLNPSTSQHCKKCGKPLAEKCPNCANAVPSSDRACGKCGFPTGHRAWVLELLAQSEEAERDRELALAETLVETAKGGWPAKSTDQLVAKITKRAGEIAQKQSQRTSALQAIDQHVAKREFYAARRELAAFAANDSERIAREGSVNKTIAEVERELLVAQKLSGDDAALACQRILVKCRDFSQARDLLKRIPPAPPSSLTVVRQGGVVQLSWKGSHSPGVSYVAVRKARARPGSIDDGQRVASVNGTNADDANPEIGVPVWYAVFSDRSGVSSSDAARPTSPILVTAEVGKAVARGSDSGVHLSWQPPANVRNVFVIRAAGTLAPTGPTDGVRIDSADNRQVLDSGLQNGRTYHYAVFGEFFDHVGKTIITSGIRLSATPQVPPKPIDSLTIEHIEAGGKRRLQIQWISPAKGQTYIIRSEASINRKGQVVPARDLAGFGAATIATTSSLVVDIPGKAVTYFTPVVVFEGNAYVGASSRYVDVPEVTGLRMTNHGAMIQIIWEWPRNVSQVLLSWSHTQFPPVSSTLNGGGESVMSRTVTQEEYSRNGYARIEQPAQDDWFIVAQSINLQGNEHVLSSGVRARLRVASLVRLEYDIRKARFGGRRELVLRTNRAATIPAVVLQVKPDVPPIDSKDGERILKLDGPIAIDGELRIDLDVPRTNRHLVAKLFLEGTGAAEDLEIRHPAIDTLRLS